MNKPITTLQILSVLLTLAFLGMVLITTVAAIKRNNWELVNSNMNTLKDIMLTGVVGYYFVRSHTPVTEPKETKNEN